MAKKDESAAQQPAAQPAEDRFAVLVKQKMDAGLPKADAETVAKAQIEHDKALETDAKK